jgi:hypothetical protein
MGKDFNSVGSNQDQMAMGINSGGQLRAVVTWNGTTVVIGSTLVVGTWYHTVVTRAGNPGTWTLYLNAVLQDTEANTHPLVDSDAPFTIGSLLPTENNFPFSGTIDEVAVYGTALSAARVQAHYDARNSAAGGGIPTKTPPGQIVSIMAHDRNAERKQQDQQVPPSRRRVRLDYRRKRGG